MRWRTAGVILTCLVFGLVTTVAIAWKIAWPLRSSFRHTPAIEVEAMYRAGPEDRTVTAIVSRRFGCMSVGSLAAWRFGSPTRAQVRAWYDPVARLPVPPWAELAGDSVATVSTSAYGWPFLCLSKTQRQRINPDTGIASHEWAV